jgi:hypothetical protein
MLRVLIGLGGLATLAVGLIFLLTFLMLDPSTMAELGGSGSVAASAYAGSVVDAALALQEHVYGIRSNQYTVADDLMQHVYAYWLSDVCGSQETICDFARSGNLQCVTFVLGAFFLGGDPLPASANAEDFWTLYQHRPGWAEIPGTAYPPETRGLPAPGDMMVWKGGGHVVDGQLVEWGHIAVVVEVVPPSHGQDGIITVAQANAPGNRWDMTHRADAGNWYSMPLHSDLSVDSWSGYTVLGYIRHVAH